MPAARWTQRLTAAHWRVLVASSLGWSFDGYEVYALVLGPMLTTLLPPARRSSLPFWAGLTIAITLLGWGIGGLIGSTLGPLTAGALIHYFGGIPRTAVAFGFVYLLGLVVAPFMLETRGRPLPE